MCGGGKHRAPDPQPAPPPPAPAETAELKVGDSEDSKNQKKKRRGSSRLTIPIQKTVDSGTGLNTMG